MELLEQLNEAQRAAVRCTEGASLIVAGAGSGKTRVLTYRIAYLLSQGVPANRIMALTFTNKAAREMKERVERLLQTADAVRSETADAIRPAAPVRQDYRYLMMGTFHSVCTRLLRPYAEQLGYTRDFTIYDTTDMKSVIKAICKERGLDDKIYKSGAVQARISMAKNSGIGPREYGMNQQLLREDREQRMYELASVYAEYEARLKAANAMDFDDLLINMLRLLNECPEACERYQQQFQYLLVDEYQDTNYIQFLLVKKLAEPQNNICVVGDDAQSIYSFRGADIRNILNFRKVYPQAQLFKLERNYRSTQTIVNAANSLIHKNRDQIYKEVYSEKEQGSPLHLQPYMDDKTEALGVATAIQRQKHKGYASFAVLYRTNAQSRVIEGELRKLNIPYRIYGGTSFYQRKEIKDALGYLRLAVNPRDNEALLRIVGFPGRGIGETTMKRVSLNAIEHHRCYLDVMRSPEETGLEVNAATAKRLRTFAAYIDGLSEQSETMDAYAFAEMAMRTSGVLTALALDLSAEGIDRAQNVQELLNAIREFVTQRGQEGIDFTPVTDFLSEVSLLTDQDEHLEDTTERVTLMTVHAAKGLEFPVVFIVGLEENLFPSQFCVKPSEIEEERRLLYVAITRAMEQCHLSFARQRFRNGTFNFASPSRFLNDIDRQFFEVKRPAMPVRPSGGLLDRSAVGSAQAPVRPTASVGSAQAPVRQAQTAIASEWKEGDRVTHRVFGKGTVQRVYRDEVTENDKIEIAFDTQGVKTLLLTHAKLEKS